MSWNSRTARWRSRLQEDVRLATITLFGGCAAIGIQPFGLYRFWNGEWLIGIADTLIVLCICMAVWHAWRSGDSRRAGLVMAATNTLGCIVVLAAFGSHAVGWVYVLMVTNFFLAPRWAAAVAGGLILLLTAMAPGLFETPLARVTFVVTSGLVGLYAWLFALRTEQQHTALERQASRDALTGAGNRRTMQRELPDAVAAFAIDAEPRALVVLDLDHFKQVNDAHGHDAGDRVLTDFVRIIETTTRSRDRLYRMGGEEFVLLLPGVDAQRLPGALEQLDARLRSALRAPSGAVGVSGGAAVLRCGEDATTWLARADAALYAAKRAGRGRLQIADGDGAKIAVERRAESVCAPDDEPLPASTGST